jgi:hypothetical protein
MPFPLSMKSSSGTDRGLWGKKPLVTNEFKMPRFQNELDRGVSRIALDEERLQPQ